jgi:hypothetical protein
LGKETTTKQQMDRLAELQDMGGGYSPLIDNADAEKGRGSGAGRASVNFGDSGNNASMQEYVSLRESIRGKLQMMKKNIVEIRRLHEGMIVETIKKPEQAAQVENLIDATNSMQALSFIFSILLFTNK